MARIFSIRTSQDGTRELEDLRDWITDEYPSNVGIRLNAQPPAPDNMGGPLVELIAALSGGTGITLARALIAYIKTRYSDLSITVVRQQDGLKFELSATNLADAEQLLTQFLETVDDPSTMDR